MRINKINIALLLGFIVIIGIIVLQFFLLREAVQYEEKKFSQKAHAVLLETVSKLNGDNNVTLPQGDPVEKIKGDYYLASVNSKFETASLDFYLKNNLDKFDLITDFEYAIYDCHTEKMANGNFVSFSEKKQSAPYSFSPIPLRGPYYFSIRFPGKSAYIYKSLKTWIIFAFVMLVVIALYGYSAFTILQQKKYSALQKDFIDNMTHEFKTPISSVLIASRFLSSQAAVAQDERLSKYSALITGQATKLNNHVEKILSLAKTENNSLRMQLAETDLVQLIHSAAEHIRMKHPAARIMVTGPAVCPIYADEFHLANVIYNLLDNAVKYSGEEPQINVSVKLHSNNILLSVADKGIGMAEKEQAKIFDKFYRIPNRIGSTAAGFGLGLFYVDRICKAHKWSLTVKSKEQVGTEVTIAIPANGKKI